MVSPADAAWAGGMPKAADESGSPICTSAWTAVAAIGMTAPASSAAPSRAGRHSAANTATTTRATMTAMSPASTGPGFAKLFPAVKERVSPAAVCSV